LHARRVFRILSRNYFPYCIVDGTGRSLEAMAGVRLTYLRVCRRARATGRKQPAAWLLTTKAALELWRESMPRRRAMGVDPIKALRHE
jgi:hypothetical protein